ncbi:MAG TPA: crossover junction endodeoxyribonuclease RuvC [Spirochaetota bacterium]|nr:crossover junction endodeoxyribonuclease RuvC [Spirochaetota bacterium]HOM37819.1 crossover junction endodeoxyribonuclease RuvC [Spirochaetota bacterium]HPQ49304.1 crossover junction endodeoxyribonuclease RuvC [Spirochaetota bacterium]
MIVLGIDPGSSRVGYGIIEKRGNIYKAITYGLIDLPPSIELSDKFLIIYNKIKEIIENYRPDIVSVEKVYFFRNQKTITEVLEARGVIILSVVQNNVKLIEVTPLQVKSITGFGRAKKDQVSKMVQMLLGIEIKSFDDVTDALAIAIAGSNYY